MAPVSEFLAHIRDLVGHERLLLPEVSVLVWDELGRLLVVIQAYSGV